MPPEYQQVYGSTESPSQSTTVSRSATEDQNTTTAASASSEDGTTSSEQTSSKRSVEQADVESRESHQPIKRRPGGAYGAWSTVAVYETRQEELTNEEREKEEEEDSSGDEDGEREDVLKFEEKTVSSLGGGRAEEPSAIVGGAFKGFGFKKRAGNRPQIRQLKTNDLWQQAMYFPLISYTC